MSKLIKFLVAAGMILLAFIVAFLLVIGLYFIKPYVTNREPKISLELNEIVIRSREIVNSYWQGHERCPSAKDLVIIEQLPLVEQIKVKSIGNRQCLLKIKIRLEDKMTKVINQYVSFTKLDQSRINYTCYHNSITQEMPYNCRQVRDIDSFNLKY